MDPRLKRRLIWNLAPAGLVLGALWYALMGADGLLDRNDMKQRLLATEDRVLQVEAQNAQLRRAIRALKTDEQAIRRAAAQELLVAEKGSTLYRLQ